MVMVIVIVIHHYYYLQLHVYVYMFICLKESSYQLVYCHVMGDASDVMGYDRRTRELADQCTTLHKTRHHQYTSIEKKTDP